ncbi:hypothetical protein K456DRAFT_1678896 [Colletotrichum gloeosporioides 23]|nr:hypothetical protein K456DRAFT_1678896 [Colletotrichum gloeosporioides 23]
MYLPCPVLPGGPSKKYVSLSVCRALRRRFTRHALHGFPARICLAALRRSAPASPCQFPRVSFVSLFFLPWPQLSSFSSPDVPNRSIASSGPPILRRGPSPPIRPMIVAPRHMQTPCSVVLFAFDAELFLLSFYSFFERNGHSACRCSNLFSLSSPWPMALSITLPHAPLNVSIIHTLETTTPLPSSLTITAHPASNSH